MDIFKCALQHFVGDFARQLDGAVHNLFNAPKTEWVMPDHNSGNFMPYSTHIIIASSPGIDPEPHRGRGVLSPSRHRCSFWSFKVLPLEKKTVRLSHHVFSKKLLIFLSLF